MKTNIAKCIAAGAFAIALALSPALVSAQEKAEKPAEKKAGAPGRAIPFHGKIDAVDKIAKTIKVGERVFQVTSETRIVKQGKPATLDDAAVGEIVGGSYVKGDDGKLNLRSLRIGPKPEGEAAGGEPKKGKKKEN
jgi:hypothetical protein